MFIQMFVNNLCLLFLRPCTLDLAFLHHYHLQLKFILA